MIGVFIQLTLSIFHMQFRLLLVGYRSVHRLTNMGFSSSPRQLNLALTLGVTLSLLVGLVLNAVVAAQAFLIVGAKFVTFGDRAAARMTLIVLALFQSVVNADTIVEHKAFALPFAISFRHLF